MYDKQSVINDYRSAYSEFQQSISGLSEEQLTKQFLDDWSVREVVGHIAGWHEQMTIGYERMAQGQRPTPEGVNWGDTQGFNMRFAQSVSGSSPSALIKDLDDKVQGFLQALEAIPDDRFGENKTVNRMAAGAGYEHFREHAEEIRAARSAGRL
jgi:uncharacterized protein (TIGR03083 family)